MPFNICSAGGQDLFYLPVGKIFKNTFDCFLEGAYKVPERPPGWQDTLQFNRLIRLKVLTRFPGGEGKFCCSRQWNKKNTRSTEKLLIK